MSEHKPSEGKNESSRSTSKPKKSTSKTVKVTSIMSERTKMHLSKMAKEDHRTNSEEIIAIIEERYRHWVDFKGRQRKTDH